MHKIDVIIPDIGATIVLQDPAPVVAEHVVQWHFHCYREGVTDVGIAFEDADANFFNVKGIWKNHFEINLHARKWMWATPHKQAPSHQRRKYTVRVWSGPGAPPEELDPHIIIDDP